MVLLPRRSIIFKCHVKSFVVSEEKAGLCVIFPGSQHFVPPVTLGFHVGLHISIEIADKCGERNEPNGGGGIAFEGETPFAGKVPPKVNNA